MGNYPQLTGPVIVYIDFIFFPLKTPEPTQHISEFNYIKNAMMIVCPFLG